jgi:hypothetical protein
MGLSFVSIKPSTSESGQCDCHFARCGSDGGPAATSALPKASIPCHPAQNETAGCFVSYSRARWLRAEPRHLLRRMTGNRHPEC